MIHWTKQLKALAQQQEATANEEGGVLAELAFWRARSANLAGVQTQLVSPGMVAASEHCASLASRCYWVPLLSTRCRISPMQQQLAQPARSLLF